MLEMTQPNALVTTDGFRLFRIQTELSLDQQGQILLPAKVFRELFPILEKADQPTITCLTTESNQEMVFQFGQTQVALSAIQGEFPTYRALIPENCAFSFSVDKELLQQKINQAMIFSREISSIVIFSVEENELIVSSQSGVRGKTESRIPLLSLEGLPEKFACNGKYVLDFLSVLESEGVKFQGNEPLKPVLFSSPDDTSLLYLVMPFKLSE
jgi:DNA polymerase-3 subunit beta